VTRLESFLGMNEIRPSHLAREAGANRQYILRLRLGTTEPTRRMMVILVTAARRILRRRVEVAEMFDLEENGRIIPP